MKKWLSEFFKRSGMKKITCDICKAKVLPKRAKTVTHNRGLADAFSGVTKFDVMDCPMCGCEITLKVRM